MRSSAPESLGDSSQGAAPQVLPQWLNTPPVGFPFSGLRISSQINGTACRVHAGFSCSEV